MKSTFLSVSVALAALAAARPLERREVPQEHSHEQFLTTVRASLNINNPLKISDPVFGLLGNTAAAGGLGQVSDVLCLQQATADQAFTNAKAAKDVAGMTAALIYRALERNTGKVGLASAPCTSIKAVNPEIAAVAQHQDPASPNAAAINKAIVLTLAKQIKSVGGNPNDALKSGTFKPGSLTDLSGKGNTCDTQNDAQGCIFSQGLLVEDATTAEIAAAVGGTTPGSPTSGTGAGSGSGAGAGTGTAQKAAVQSPAESVCSNTGNPPNKQAAAAAPAPASPASAGLAAGISLGSCGTNPDIIFGVGFDGRTEASFEPANKAAFNHGSAQKIDNITSFICGQLPSQCKANAAATAACARGQAATMGKTGQAAADAFNAAFR